ncbi:hypothetical protein MKW98_013808, partial [Papaver atlanticum]
MKMLSLWVLSLGFVSFVVYSKDWVLVEAGFEGFKFAQEEAIFHVDGVPSTSDSSDPKMVDLTLIQGATDKGAVCLDGTVPGYHLDRGFGSGANSWLIQLEGGGWCNTIRNCVYRQTTRRGSSKFMEKKILFTGILSDKAEQNP